MTGVGDNTASSGLPTLPPVPVGPPWSLDAVADVHAGVFPIAVERNLRVRMNQDPSARDMLAQLGSVVDELSLLPPLTMPEQYASRLDAAIAGESTRRADVESTRRAGAESVRRAGAGSAPVIAGRFGPGVADGAGRGSTAVPPSAPPTPVDERGSSLPIGVSSLDAARRRRRGVLGGLGIAAAVAAIAAVVITTHRPGDAGTLAGALPPGAASAAASPGAGGNFGSAIGDGAPGPGNGTEPATTTTGSSEGVGRLDPAQTIEAGSSFAIRPGRLQAAFDRVQGRVTGTLADPLVYAGCLASLHIAGPSVLGAADVDDQGRPAVALAVSVAGDPGHATLLIIASGCGASGATVLERQTVSR